MPMSSSPSESTVKLLAGAAALELEAPPEDPISQRQMEHRWPSERRWESCATSASVKGRPLDRISKTSSASSSSGSTTEPAEGVGSHSSKCPGLLCILGSPKILASPASSRCKPSTVAPLGNEALSRRGSLVKILRRTPLSAGFNVSYHSPALAVIGAPESGRKLDARNCNSWEKCFWLPGPDGSGGTRGSSGLGGPGGPGASGGTTRTLRSWPDLAFTWESSVTPPAARPLSPSSQ
mmetsp:Transcript_58187/g.125796  ORF Transcript_58187/g.125796 Transcript_58187/m.125796 type:complete len:237 (-) Transcript_58187:472-1182(-)